MSLCPLITINHSDFALEKRPLKMPANSIPEVTSTSRSVDPSALSEIVFVCSSYNNARFDSLICCSFSSVSASNPRLAQLRNPMDRIMFLEEMGLLIVAIGSIFL